ncbi:hypothetical protein BDN70DRAFT_705995 [Pholiota conissans]|uniref:Uncharacterized protein n=1 Tax=Pholiota conissans TaxID=109636 RepID=A0A9P6CZB4_9AGAR|nr:hypothetical protein BDN70DRAFT_705995 [Pholiota conissans]
MRALGECFVGPSSLEQAGIRVPLRTYSLRLHLHSRFGDCAKCQNAKARHELTISCVNSRVHTRHSYRSEAMRLKTP